jgi:DNA transformation protein
MTVSAGFKAQIRELFEGLGELRIRPMFGGAGVYLDDLFFALADDDVLYLKVDDETEARFRDAGSEVFVYATKAGERMALRYWRLPDTAFDDPEEAAEWGRLALSAASRAVAKKSCKT